MLAKSSITRIYCRGWPIFVEFIEIYLCDFLDRFTKLRKFIPAKVSDH